MSETNVPIRVMVVDDSRDIHVVVATICRANETIRLVGDAYSGEEAISLVRTIQPDVVLVDIVMPGMSGIEAARQIASAQPRVRIIALSSLSEYNFIRDMLALGAVGYLVKDVLAEDLLNAIRTASGGSTVLSPAAASMLIHPSPAPADFKLTQREIEILNCMSKGLTDAQIAGDLSISTSTVRFHQNNILSKMNVATRSQALVSAAHNGLI